MKAIYRVMDIGAGVNHRGAGGGPFDCPFGRFGFALFLEYNRPVCDFAGYLYLYGNNTCNEA